MTTTSRSKKLALTLLATTLMMSNAHAKSSSERAGDILQILIPTATYSSTFVMDDEEGRNEFYKSFATNIVVTEGLKYAINKPRPENNGDRAFPSGHTSITFQSAAFVQKRYGVKYSIPIYVAATYVGWSRVDAKKHDWVDVAGGAAVGILSSYYFTKPYKGVTITPEAGNGFYGVTLSKSW